VGGLSRRARDSAVTGVRIKPPSRVMKWCAAVAALSTAHAAHWAVIMAGSNGYYNYRHQADACHAYQIAKRHGIPESNIILLAYDDIASSHENPFPGQIFNSPNGTDVYRGCKISYSKEQVTAANFIKVLKGDSSAPGPVLKSTAEDRVFVYYADHGGPGILGVPSGAGPTIHAADVNDALVDMHTKGMYKELLFYLEACESGSIFAKLLKAPKVKAVTAANPKESSWGYYCAPKDKVQGKSIGSCLGDEFSIHWMEDADVSDGQGTETIKQQVDKVREETKKSHVQEYGDDSLDSEPIGNFEGSSGVAARLAGEAGLRGDGAAVSGRDVEVHVAYYKVKRARSFQEKMRAELELAALLERRRLADVKFYGVALAAVHGNESRAQELVEGDIAAITKVACHKAALSASVEHCGAFTDYSMRYSRLLVNLCESGMAQDRVVAALQEGCGGALGCTGSADPPSAECYQGKAGALGVTENVKVDVKSYSVGKGTLDLSGTGIQPITCTGKTFTKSGQDLSIDLSGCLPSKVTISSVKYCSDSDAIRVTVKDSSVPIPISATLSKVPCSASAGQIVV